MVSEDKKQTPKTEQSWGEKKRPNSRNRQRNQGATEKGNGKVGGGEQSQNKARHENAESYARNRNRRNRSNRRSEQQRYQARPHESWEEVHRDNGQIIKEIQLELAQLKEITLD